MCLDDLTELNMDIEAGKHDKELADGTVVRPGPQKKFNVEAPGNFGEIRAEGTPDPNGPPPKKTSVPKLRLKTPNQETVEVSERALVAGKRGPPTPGSGSTGGGQKRSRAPAEGWVPSMEDLGQLATLSPDQLAEKLRVFSLGVSSLALFFPVQVLVISFPIKTNLCS